MSSTTVSVPKYRHHKGSGQAFIQIKGRRRYLGKWDSPASKEAYGRLVAEMAVSPAAAEKLTPLTPAAAQLTVVELCAAYLDYAEGYYRKDGYLTRSIEEARASIRILTDLYGRTPAADFGPLGLLAIQAALATDRARSYVNKLVGYIKRIFKWGVSRQMVPFGVHVALTTVGGLKRGRTAAREPAPIRPVDADVVDATIPFLPLVVADMVKLQRLTGCRPGEVCLMRPGDIDRSGEVWTYRPRSHKTDYRGRERTIFVGPKAQAILLHYLLRGDDDFCFSPAESVAKRQVEVRARRKTRVQPSQQSRRKRCPRKTPGDHYTRHSYCQAITRAILTANRQRTKDAAQSGVAPLLLPHWHPNQLRHSAATEIRKTYGLEAAQVILGHSKADVTQVYAERDLALAADVARRIG